MSTTETPRMTREQIRARLAEIAPWPGWGRDKPATAKDVARYLAVHAGLGHARNVTPFITDAQEVPASLICAQFAAVHALMALAEVDPARAGEVAQEITEDWAGGGLGSDLWDHLTVLDVDANELARLDEARLALENAEREVAGEPSP